MKNAVILDAKAEIGLTEEQAERFWNELQRIEQLRVGLDYLYNNVHKVEQLHPPDADRMVWSLGSDPDHRILPVTRKLVHCSFHWYSVTLCNHCGLIGKIAEQAIPERKDEWQIYRKKVCGPVLTYRNKVGAHFAWVKPIISGDDPKNRDNPADEFLSTLHDLTLHDGRFFVGQARVSLGAGESFHQSKHNYAWSLALKHEELDERYRWLASP